MPGGDRRSGRRETAPMKKATITCPRGHPYDMERIAKDYKGFLYVFRGCLRCQVAASQRYRRTRKYA